MLRTFKRALFRKFGYQKVEHWNKFLSGHEAQQMLFKKKPIHCIFDVGANVGQTAKAYRRRFPNTIIHSFEPFPESYETLKTRYAHDSKVFCHRLALSDQDGSLPFHVNSGSTTNSLLLPHAEGASWSPPGVMIPVGSITVPTKKIDTFCEEHNIAHIDILKMDVQGGELKVLQGAEGMLKKKAIGLVFSEVLFVPLYEKQAQFFDIAAYLSPFGYSLYDLFNCRYSASGQIKWADAIFLKDKS